MPPGGSPTLGGAEWCEGDSGAVSWLPHGPGSAALQAHEFDTHVSARILLAAIQTHSETIV